MPDRLFPNHKHPCWQFTADSMPIIRNLIYGFAVLILVSGCKPKEQIQTYYFESSKSDQQEDLIQTPEASGTISPANNIADRGEPTHRMLAAVLKTDQKAWFIKAVAGIDQIGQAEEKLIAFLEDIDLKSGQPTWELPEGWTTGPEKTMRLATLFLPLDDSNVEDTIQIEISIIGLPITGEWQEQILSNINRWRGQLGREPITIGLLSEMTKPMTVSEGSVLFDAIGWFDDAGMSNAPFAQMKPPLEAKPKPSNPMTGSVPVGRGELKETPPSDWKVLPGSAMRKASYTTANESTVTAFVFPATAPAMADPLANINRWRGEIGLEPTTAEQLVKETKSITLGGENSVYIELMGEKESTLAAMSVLGDQVWFFKLRGTKEAVETDRESFKKWLSTVQF